MRASTMGILALAILIGLGATAAARYAGVFDSTTPPAVKEEPIKVLVAKNNLFAGTTITANDVEIRDLLPDEKSKYEQMKSRLAPPLYQWANFRVPARNIDANSLLSVEDFQDLEMAKSMPDRIGPGMKAVQVALPKERAAGGLLRVGEYVDVVATATISIPTSDGEVPVTRTAVIARDAKIIVKRNNLWTVMMADPENALVPLTLEVNPYRAALIEYAKEKGTLSIVPSSGSTIRPVVGVGVKRTFGDANSTEYRDEDNRVAAMERGELTVGDHDLVRIFKISIPPPAPAPPSPHRIEMVSGIGTVGVRQFENTDGVEQTNEPPMAGSPGGNGNGNVGTAPTGPLKISAPKKNCPTCGKGAKK